MRIVEKKVQEPQGVKGEAVEKDKTPGKTVGFGKEDLFLVFTVALILMGLVLGKLTFEQALGYFGVTSAGGVWGWLGGNTSAK